MDSRRLWFAIVTWVVILVLVTSCAQPTSESPEATMAVPQEEPTKDLVSTAMPLEYDVEVYGDLGNMDPSGQMVVYWYQHTGSREELLLSLVDEFNRANEWGIVVQGEYQGDYDELYERIIAGIPDNRLPSVAVAVPDQVAAYAAKGASIPLDPYIASERWGYTKEELRDFFPVARDTDYLPQFEAHYGFPAYKSVDVMYYNEDWLAELGYDGPPETWEEFGEMACAAAEQPFSGATGEEISFGYAFSVNASRFATFVFSRGGNTINGEGTGYVFNGPEGLDSVIFLKDLVDRGCAVEQTERYGDQNEFGSGRSLFAISSSFRLPFYVEAISEGAGFSWSVNPPPHTIGVPRINASGASQSIFVTSPAEQLAAWLFIKWMSEPEQQAEWASGTGYFAIRQSATDMLADYLAENPVYEKAFGFMALDYGTESTVVGYDRCRSTIAEMLTAILRGEGAQAQLDTAVDQCDRYLTEAAP